MSPGPIEPPLSDATHGRHRARARLRRHAAGVAVLLALAVPMSAQPRGGGEVAARTATADPIPLSGYLARLKESLRSSAASRGPRWPAAPPRKLKSTAPAPDGVGRTSCA